MKASSNNTASKNDIDLPVPVAGYTFQTNFEHALGLRPTPLPPVNTLSSSNAGQNFPSIHYICDTIQGLTPSLHHFSPILQRTLPPSLPNVSLPPNFQSFNVVTEPESIVQKDVILEDSQSDSQGIGLLKRLIHTHDVLLKEDIICQQKVISKTNVEKENNSLLKSTNNTNKYDDVNDTSFLDLESNIQFQYHSNILLQKLHSMTMRQEYCDLKIVVGDSSWFCHICVIASMSSLLHELLFKNYEQNACKKLQMTLPQTIDGEVFGNIMQIIYTGKLTVKKSILRKIIYVADYLKLSEIHKKCCEYLNSSYTNLISNFSKHDRSTNIASLIQVSGCERFDSEVNMEINECNEVNEIESSSSNRNNSIEVLKEPVVVPEVLQVSEDQFQDQEKGRFEDLVKVASQLVSHEDIHSMTGTVTTPQLKLSVQHDKTKADDEENKTTNLCRFCGKLFENMNDKVEHILSTHGWDKHALRKQCGICQSAFKTSKQLQRHLTSKHNGNRYQCRFCVSVFKQLIKCEHHERSAHTKQIMYSCPVCSKGFYIHQHFKRHMKNHEEIEKFKCQICGKILTSKLGFDNHQSAVHGEKKWVCTFPNCDGKFGNEKALQRHITNHTRSNKFQCDDCQQSFKYTAHLKRHKDEVHAEEACREFACDQCNLRFHRPFQLKAHKVSHTDRRDHQCNVCRKTFKHKASLYIHQKKHSGVYDFVCDVCGQTFVTKTNLVEHAVKHASQSPYLCQICGQQFKAVKYMRRHMLKHSESDRDGITSDNT